MTHKTQERFQARCEPAQTARLPIGLALPPRAKCLGLRQKEPYCGCFSSYPSSTPPRVCKHFPGGHWRKEDIFGVLSGASGSL